MEICRIICEKRFTKVIAVSMVRAREWTISERVGELSCIVGGSGGLLVEQGLPCGNSNDVSSESRNGTQQNTYFSKTSTNFRIQSQQTNGPPNQ